VYFKKEDGYNCYYSGMLSSDGQMDGFGKYMQIYFGNEEYNIGWYY